MKYSEIYSKSYDENYVQLEAFCKNYFVEAKADSRIYIDTLNELINQIYSNRFKIFSVTYDKEIEELVFLFDKKYSLYEKNEIDFVLEKKIKKEFNENCHFPKKYHFEKFIEELGKFDASREISRLLSINYPLFELFYKLNEFNDFEITDYKGNLESQPIFNKYLKTILNIQNEKSNYKDFKTLEKTIFKNDGIDIFNFIINDLKGITKENVSFYSKLFHFLQELNKIDTNSEDNVDYRNYIKLISNIKSFSRILPVEKKFSKRKNEIYQKFDESLNKFNIQKNKKDKTFKINSLKKTE